MSRIIWAQAAVYNDRTVSFFRYARPWKIALPQDISNVRAEKGIHRKPPGTSRTGALLQTAITVPASTAHSVGRERQ